jgi:hypothetical protein
MNWVLFYLLAALHPVAFMLIALKCNTWKLRFLLWALLPLPAVWYCWDYYAIQNEHAQMCAAEGGLKVLIQPERVDRVRVKGDAPFSKYLLEKYYPQVKVVEAFTEQRDPVTGRPMQYYEAYTATPNPKAGQWIKGSPQEGKFLFPSTRVDVLDPTLYELSKRESKIADGSKTELFLSKGGRVYAKYTELVHWWTGIQYPDALTTWRCPDMKPSPPKGEPNAPYQQWVHPPSPLDQIPDLIFK